MQKAKKVHLGLLEKNENKIDEMQDIVGHLHQYVPGHSSDSQNMPLHKITSGGDYLTFERHKRAQELHADGNTPSNRLEGLIPNMEFFHLQAEWDVTVWKYLYKTNSQKDIGTLYAARNAINARNVTQDPRHNFYAAEELLNKYTESYLLSGALHFFGLETLEEIVPDERFDSKVFDVSVSKEVRTNLIKQVAREFITSFTDYGFPVLDDTAPVKLRLDCRICGKVYEKGPKSLRKHEEKKHNFVGNQDKVSDPAITTDKDMVLQYTKCTLSLLLLRLNMNDAIHMGDGDRMYDCMQLMYLYFKEAGCFKYAYGCLESLAQVKCFLSRRMSTRLKYNRTVNTSGKYNTNFPKDLDVEHNNKLVKDEIHAFRGKITEKTLNRIGRSIDSTDKTVRNFDRCTGVRRPSGRHGRVDTSEDVSILLRQYQKANLFSDIPGRFHSAFPVIKSNPLTHLDHDKMKQWFYNSLRDMSERHFYNIF